MARVRALLASPMPRSPLPEPLGSAGGASEWLFGRAPCAGNLGRLATQLPVLPGHQGKRNVLGVGVAMMEARL